MDNYLKKNAEIDSQIAEIQKKIDKIDSELANISLFMKKETSGLFDDDLNIMLNYRGSNHVSVIIRIISNLNELEQKLQLDQDSPKPIFSSLTNIFTKKEQKSENKLADVQRIQSIFDDKGYNKEYVYHLRDEYAKLLNEKDRLRLEKRDLLRKRTLALEEIVLESLNAQMSFPEGFQFLSLENQQKVLFEIRKSVSKSIANVVNPYAEYPEACDEELNQHYESDGFQQKSLTNK